QVERLLPLTDREPECLDLALRAVVVLERQAAVLEGDVEVVVEVRADRRVPREVPAHALLEGLDLDDGRVRHARERGVAHVQMREMADLVCEPRAARASGVLVVEPHEVVDEELAATLEQLGETELAVAAP